MVELFQTRSVISGNTAVVPVMCVLQDLLVFRNKQKPLVDEDFNNKGSSAIRALWQSDCTRLQSESLMALLSHLVW